MWSSTLPPWTRFLFLCICTTSLLPIKMHQIIALTWLHLKSISCCKAAFMFATQPSNRLVKIFWSWNEVSHLTRNRWRDSRRKIAAAQNNRTSRKWNRRWRMKGTKGTKAKDDCTVLTSQNHLTYVGWLLPQDLLLHQNNIYYKSDFTRNPRACSTLMKSSLSSLCSCYHNSRMQWGQLQRQM